MVLQTAWKKWDDRRPLTSDDLGELSIHYSIVIWKKQNTTYLLRHLIAVVRFVLLNQNIWDWVIYLLYEFNLYGPGGYEVWGQEAAAREGGLPAVSRGYKRCHTAEERGWRAQSRSPFIVHLLIHEGGAFLTWTLSPGFASCTASLETRATCSSHGPHLLRGEKQPRLSN